MTVAPFYLMIGAALVGIFLYFKPLKVDIAEADELPQIELTNFRVHDVTTEGVKTVLAGKNVRRFDLRYVVSDINLTDRGGSHIENMQARRGIYEAPMVFLEDKVRYARDDGVVFTTSKAEYNQTSGLIRTFGRFTLNREQDTLTGYDLLYGTRSGDIAASRIKGDYRMKEKM